MIGQEAHWIKAPPGYWEALRRLRDELAKPIRERYWPNHEMTMNSPSQYGPDNMSETRNVAIIGGGDWYDASVDFVTVPADLDLEQAKKDWRDYYNNDYCPRRAAWDKLDYHTRPRGPQLLDFKEWLQSHRGGVDWDCETFDDT